MAMVPRKFTSKLKNAELQNSKGSKRENVVDRIQAYISAQGTESGAAFYAKPTSNKARTRFFIPASSSLLEPIECLLQFHPPSLNSFTHLQKLKAFYGSVSTCKDQDFNLIPFSSTSVFTPLYSVSPQHKPLICCFPFHNDSSRFLS